MRGRRGVLPLEFGSVNAGHQLGVLEVVLIFLNQKATSFLVQSGFRVWIDEEALDSQKNVANAHFGLPVLLQCVNANLTLCGNVGVKDFGNEGTCRRMKKSKKTAQNLKELEILVPLGGADGKSGPSFILILKTPPSKGVSSTKRRRKVRIKRSVRMTLPRGILGFQAKRKA